MAGIAHLQQENIKLRQERNTTLDLMVVAQNKIDALTEENAALRQVVRDLLLIATDSEEMADMSIETFQDYQDEIVHRARRLIGEERA